MSLPRGYQKKEVFEITAIDRVTGKIVDERRWFTEINAKESAKMVQALCPEARVIVELRKALILTD